MPDPLPLLGVLVLGVLAAFLLARNAQERVSRLEARITAIEDRLRRLQEQLDARLQDQGDVPPEEDTAGVVPQVEEPRAEAPVISPAVPATVVERLPLSPTATATEPTGESRSNLEELIGGRWLLFAGVAAIVLGVSYFVKFAFDNGWISEPLRVAAGILIGFLLLGGGVRSWSRGLPLFGQALAGAGILVHYISIYAALHFYGLTPAGVAFALMVLVTAGAAFLADRQRSQPLAALALIGGFATPLLVGGDRDAQVVLFTYMGILIAGVVLIVRRHAWPLLGAASYLCTLTLVVMWFFSSYEGQHWLRTELFLTAYLMLFVYLLRAALQASRTWALHAQLALTVLATAPLAYHLASLVLLAQHPGAWLVYVVAATAAGLLVAHRMRAGGLRLLLLLIVGLPMAGWLEALPYPRWYVPAVITLIALYVLHLAAQWEAHGHEEGSARRITNIVHTHLNGLLLPFALYLFLEDRYSALNSWMTGALAVWNAGLAAVTRAHAPRLMLSFLAVAATLGAVTVALAFDGPAVAVGWAADGVLVGWLAARERSRPLAVGSGVLISLGCLQLINLLTGPLPVGDTPFLNGRALATALVIGLVAWLAWRIEADPVPEVRHRARTALIIGANLLGLVLISADLRAYFAQRAVDASIAGRSRDVSDAGLAEQVALSVTWALYAVGLVFTGIRRRFAPARYLAIVLFAVVIVKVLVNDIAGLDRLYRMLSVLGVGVLLVLASYLYQKRSGDPESRGA